ncbi:MAG: glycerate kinase [Bacteroidaceae bacterium]|nr:glycerate kinase [Bacteroidaceae bacterium]
MTLTLAFDSFKGSLRSDEVADAFAQGLCSVLPSVNINKVYIADGGEGTAEALVKNLNGKTVRMQVSDPLGRTIPASYGIIEHEKTAIIEMAVASGLTLLAPEERNPLKTHTYGTGQLIIDAMEKGCRNFLVGIGGSATNDGGTGMLRALGFRFLDDCGNELCGGGEILEQIDRIDASGMIPTLNECRFTLACDVDNPFFGPNGAAHVFAPQKGADPEMVERLDNGLRNFARTVMQFNGTELNRLPGSGAAGGMGGGCAALLGARLERGIDMVLRAIRFRETIKGSSMVITGEGQIDRQTLMGKAPAGILAAAMQQQIPVIAIGGRVVPCPELAQSGFHSILCINEEGLPPQTAMRHEVAWENVRRCGTKVGKMLQKRMEQPV